MTRDNLKKVQPINSKVKESTGSLMLSDLVNTDTFYAYTIFVH